MPRAYSLPRSQERSSPQSGSRRDFLKTSAAGVSGIALASALGLAPRRARADHQLTYAFWPWGSEIVAEGARNFEEQYGERLNLQPIPGEYAAVLETRLASGQAFDLFRAQRGQASRWYAAQWIRPIDDLPDLDMITAEEFPGIGADARSWPDGKRIGLTYYNGGPFCLFRNEQVLSAAGYEATANPAEYPQTWDEVYKQAVDIKNKGIVEHPILPAWYKAWTGTPWALYAQAFSEGEYFVDDDMKATFGPDTPLLKVLTDWKQWWDEDLVPRAILTWQDSQMSNSWMKGLHAFHSYIDYQSFIYADPANSEIHDQFNMNPVMPGATHETTLVGHALHCMSNVDRTDEDLERAWTLMKFYSWRDKEGELTVHKRWAREANLEVPFPEVYDDPEVQTAIKKWLYPPLVDESYQWLFEGRQKAIAGNQLKASWFQEWEVVMQETIEQEMLINGSKTPRDTVVFLHDLWEELRDKYT
jgi:multiple sugar transport system substrate-binding protein